MKPARTGISRLWHASGHSWRGLKATFRNESAFRQELLLAVVLFVASLWLAQTPIEWLILVAPLLVLLIVEITNSAIESIVDRIGPEQHELSGRAKDQGSAAVLLALILLGVCWGTVIWGRFYG